MSTLVSLCAHHCDMKQMITTVACRWGQESSTWRFFFMAMQKTTCSNMQKTICSKHMLALHSLSPASKSLN